jgi:mannose/fructose-specific phosphotransferase system component IIA
MNILLVSNGILAESLNESMHNFFSKPAINSICFIYGKTEAAKSKLKKYFAKHSANKDSSFIILCDAFGNTAFNETVLLLHQLKIQKNTLMICGMDLLMVFKLYGLKDCANIELCRSLYEQSEDKGIFVYTSAEIQKQAISIQLCNHS